MFLAKPVILVKAILVSLESRAKPGQRARRLGKSPLVPLFKRGTKGDLDLKSLELSSRISKAIGIGGYR